MGKIAKTILAVCVMILASVVMAHLSRGLLGPGAAATLLSSLTGYGLGTIAAIYIWEVWSYD